MIVVGVEEETVPIAPDAADGECQLVCNDGAADEGLALTSVPLATTQLARLGPVERRPTRLGLERTARGVAPGEGPLWPTQHFGRCDRTRDASADVQLDRVGRAEWWRVGHS